MASEARRRLEDKLQDPAYRAQYIELLESYRDLAEKLPGGPAQLRETIQASFPLMTSPHSPQMTAEYALLQEDIDAYLAALEQGEDPTQGEAMDD